MALIKRADRPYTIHLVEAGRFTGHSVEYQPLRAFKSKVRAERYIARRKSVDTYTAQYDRVVPLRFDHVVE